MDMLCTCGAIVEPGPDDGKVCRASMEVEVAGVQFDSPALAEAVEEALDPLTEIESGWCYAVRNQVILEVMEGALLDTKGIAMDAPCLWEEVPDPGGMGGAWVAPGI